MSKRTSFAIKWALVTGFIWLVFHVVSGVRNLVGLMFEAYDDRTLGYAAAYLVCLLLFDVGLFLISSPEAGKVLERYWAVCTMVLALLTLLALLGEHLRFELPGWTLLVILVTPYFPLDPIWRNFLPESGGLLQIVGTLLVCLLHWGYCRLALYRAGNSSATAF